MESIQPDIARFYLDELLPALQRLDRLLEQAVTKTYGPDTDADPYRGLYISNDDVERMLSFEPGQPTLKGEKEEPEELLEVIDEASRLAWLSRALGLFSFDLDLLLIALAPDIDRRYEPLFAFLHDHVSRRRPSVDLALNLLCPDAVAKLERRAHFEPEAPLLRHGLIYLTPEVPHEQPSLLGHTMRVDQQIVSFLLYQNSLDRRLMPFCEVVDGSGSTDALSLPAREHSTLTARALQAREDQQPLRLYFRGPAGSGKRQAAEALAAALDLPLLVVDLARALVTDLDFPDALRLAFRHAWFNDTLLYLEGVDALRHESRHLYLRDLVQRLTGDAGTTILSGTEPWLPTGRVPTGVITISFSSTTFGQRRACWQDHLSNVGITLDAADLDTLAGRFRLRFGQIAEAVTTALQRARWRAARQPDGKARLNLPEPTLDDLITAARAQTGHALAALAHKIDPSYTWEDIVLPSGTLTPLQEMCRRVVHRHQVLDTWGFEQKLSQGKGVNALFVGPSGTGKTMAAEVIANDLKLDLYRINLAGVVSKYIGETEKNLDRIFKAAEEANAILFFDEADALFGKRSEVHDAHDRYANVEVSYLLQRMEAYEGITILATNLRQNLDEAFIRRLAFTVHFPFPEAEYRRRIWAGIWPEATPLDEDLDLDTLAHRFKLSGGNIKNIALAAAFLAAAEDRPVAMQHVLRALEHEYQKMGKTLSKAERNGFYQDVML